MARARARAAPERARHDDRAPSSAGAAPSRSWEAVAQRNEARAHARSGFCSGCEGGPGTAAAGGGRAYSASALEASTFMFLYEPARPLSSFLGVTAPMMENTMR